MNIRNCKNCGRIFNYVAGVHLCQPCKEKMEEKFQEVKEYIRSNPGVGIREVSEACDVDPGQIRQWLREDRSPIFLNCDKCGAAIRSGKFCDKCKANMTSDLKSVLKESRPVKKEPEKPEKEKPRMRYL